MTKQATRFQLKCAVQALCHTVILTSSAAAIAQATPHHDNQLTIMGGYAAASNVTTQGDDPQRINIKDGSGYSIVYNRMQQRKQPNINLQYEFVFAQNSLTPQFPLEDGQLVDENLDITHLHVGGLYEWEHSKNLTSYFGGTIGMTHMEVSTGESEVDPSIAFSLGLKIPIGERIMARVEGRIYGVAWDSNSTLFCSTGGELESGICRFTVDANMWWHQQLNAGVAFRF